MASKTSLAIALILGYSNNLKKLYSCKKSLNFLDIQEFDTDIVMILNTDIIMILNKTV